MKTRTKIVITLTIIGGIMSACVNKKFDIDYRSKHFEDGKFFNEELRYNPELSQLSSALYEFTFHKSKDSQPKDEIPVIKLTKKDLLEMEDYSVVRFGHSTLLFKLDNRFVMTDPLFSERASPLSFVGPKRFHKPPMEIEDLPFIDIVIISHDHYDHLDGGSIKRLKDRVGRFYTTLKVGAILQSYGVPREKIVELDWWQNRVDSSLNLICTPAQHFSGRGLLDKDQTLWSSWVIEAPDAQIYFGADSGYFSGFKKIAEKYGPFDMTFLEVGAYNEMWKVIHMMPYQSIQAHLDLQGKVMFPIHNGTFDLALHSWREPFEKIDQEATKHSVPIVYPKMGEVISLLKENRTEKWWR